MRKQIETNWNELAEMKLQNCKGKKMKCRTESKEMGNILLMKWSCWNEICRIENESKEM